MADARRIEELIPSRQAWLAPERVTQHPLLLEPGHVAELPDQGIHDGQIGHAELVVVEIRDQPERP